MHQGDLQDAHFHLQHYVDRHPFDVYGHALFAHVCTRLGKHVMAATETERILSLMDATGLTSPTITLDKLALQKRLCALYVRIGKGDKALELLEVLGDDPELAPTKASAFLVAGKYDEAQFLYNDVTIKYESTSNFHAEEISFEGSQKLGLI